MGKAMNVVSISGYLGQDPELKLVGSAGTPVVNVNVAVDCGYTTPEGVKHEKTVWVPIKIWRGSAGAFAKHFRKGDGVLVEGRLDVESWTDKATGAPRTKMVVVVENWYFPPSHKSGGARKAAPATAEYGEVDF